MQTTETKQHLSHFGRHLKDLRVGFIYSLCVYENGDHAHQITILERDEKGLSTGMAVEGIWACDFPDVLAKAYDWVIHQKVKQCEKSTSQTKADTTIATPSDSAN